MSRSSGYNDVLISELADSRVDELLLSKVIPGSEFGEGPSRRFKTGNAAVKNKTAPTAEASAPKKAEEM